MQLQAIVRAVFAAQIVRQSVDGTEQAIPDAVHVEFVMTHDGHQITVAQFKQLDQPVLDLDLTMGTRFAQARCIGERACAMVVETT